MSEIDVLARIDALQMNYVRALDKRDMNAWAGCFDAETASYECIARENVEQGLPLAVMLDDSAARIRDRANFVNKVWAGTFEDYTTRHFVQRLECREVGLSLYESETNFLVGYTTPQGVSQILVAGVYVDRMVVDNGGARFQLKRAILDTTVTPRYLVYPV